MKKLKPEDIVETERLILKIPSISDAQIMYDLIDESVTEYMEWDKSENYTKTEERIKETIQDAENGTSWEAAMYLKSGQLIGRFGMHTLCEREKSIMLGYWLARDYRGHGYISECVEWVKEYGFTEMGLDKITLRCVKENSGSRKVAERAGFQLDGILRHDQLQKGKYVDNCYYSFLREDYGKK